MVAARLSARCAITRSRPARGKVAATTSVGAVWLPLAAATSQEAMLRAEQALERARANGRDGFAVYAESPQRDTARLRQMSIADEVIHGAEGKPPPAGLSAHRRCQDAQGPSHYECLLRMLRPDGQEVTAGYFVPAAEQMGIVHLVDRFALETAVQRSSSRHDEHHLGVNVSGTAALDPAWLQSFVDYVRENRECRQSAGGGADRNRCHCISSRKMRVSSRSCANWACGWRSTISAPAIPHSATCR